MIDRRALLLAGAMLPVAARAQCVTEPASRGCVPRWGAGQPAPAPAMTLDLMNPGVLDPGITFTRASVGTYFDATGAMQTAARGGAPRWDYDPVTHALRGLFIEETRTNLLLNSRDARHAVCYHDRRCHHALSFYGTGTVTLSGTSTAGPLTGTGAFRSGWR